MKITVTPAGDIVLELPTNEASPDTVALVCAIQRIGRPQPILKFLPTTLPELIDKPVAKPEPRKRGVSKLSPALAETRNLLASTPNVVKPVQVAAELGIETPAANWRLRELVNKGFAYRAGRGHYKLVPKRG